MESNCIFSITNNRYWSIETKNPDIINSYVFVDSDDPCSPFAPELRLYEKEVEGGKIYVIPALEGFSLHLPTALCGNSLNRNFVMSKIIEHCKIKIAADGGNKPLFTIKDIDPETDPSVKYSSELFGVKPIILSVTGDYFDIAETVKEISIWYGVGDQTTWQMDYEGFFVEFDSYRHRLITDAAAISNYPLFHKESVAAFIREAIRLWEIYVSETPEIRVPLLNTDITGVDGLILPSDVAQAAIDRIDRNVEFEQSIVEVQYIDKPGIEDTLDPDFGLVWVRDLYIEDDRVMAWIEFYHDINSRKIHSDWENGKVEFLFGCNCTDRSKNFITKIEDIKIYLRRK